jgi:hypothetical protein
LRTDSIAATIIDGEAVIVNLSTGVYYSLTGSGPDAWTWLEQGHSIGEVAQALASRWSVPAEQAAGDVQRLAEQLLQEELVSIANGLAPAASLEPGTASQSGYQAPVLEAYRDMEDLLALDPPMPGLRDVPWKPAANK